MVAAALHAARGATGAATPPTRNGRGNALSGAGGGRGASVAHPIPIATPILDVAGTDLGPRVNRSIRPAPAVREHGVDLPCSTEWMFTRGRTRWLRDSGRT